MSNNSSIVYDFTIVTYKLAYYAVLVVCNTGIIANICNILVCFEKELQNNTMGFYNILLSIFNILALIFSGYLSIFKQTLSEEQFISTSYINCILISFFTRVFSQMATWVNVMLTLDRMFCVLYLNRIETLKVKTKLAWMVLALIGFLFCVNVPNLFYYLDNITTNDTTKKVCTSSTIMVWIRDAITLLMRVALPLSVQISLNLVLVYKLHKLNNNKRLAIKFIKELRFTLTVIVLNLIYIITDLPALVSTIFINVYGYDLTYVSTRSNESAIASLAYVCTVIFATLNFVAPFFVNLIFYRQFRLEAKRIFCTK